MWAGNPTLPSCPSPWSCEPWRPSRAGLVWGGGALFPSLAARDPTGWGQRIWPELSQSGHGGVGGGNLWAVPPSLKVQVSAPWPPFFVSVEELGAGIPSFTNHAGMDFKKQNKTKKPKNFTFFLQKLQGRVMFPHPLWQGGLGLSILSSGPCSCLRKGWRKQLPG